MEGTYTLCVSPRWSTQQTFFLVDTGKVRYVGCRALLFSLCVCMIVLCPAFGLGGTLPDLSHKHESSADAADLQIALPSKGKTDEQGADKQRRSSEGEGLTVQDELRRSTTRNSRQNRLSVKSCQQATSVCPFDSSHRHSGNTQRDPLRFAAHRTHTANCVCKKETEQARHDHVDDEAASLSHGQRPEGSNPRDSLVASFGANATQASLSEGPSYIKTGDTTSRNGEKNPEDGQSVTEGGTLTRCRRKTPRSSIRPSSPELKSGVAKTDIRRRANKPKIYGYPFRESYILPCGKYKLMSLSKGLVEHPESTYLKRMQEGHKKHVQEPSVEAHATFRSIRHEANTKSYRIAFLSWNAELINPEPMEVLLPFARTSPSTLLIDEQDVVLVVFQENLRPTRDLQRRFTEQTLHGLNGLSRIKNWVAGASLGLFLSNLYGTKLVLKKPLTTNSQGLIWFRRSNVPVQAVKSCSHSVRASEKGFIGTMLSFEGAGAVLFVGVHVSASEPGPQLDKLLNLLDVKCSVASGEHKGHVDGTVLLAGDFNARLSSGAVGRALAVTEGNKEYPLMTVPTTAPATDVERLMRAFTPEGKEALPKDFEDKYAALLWSVDTMGGAQSEPATEIRQALLAHDFTHTNACYEAGFTYDYQKSCGVKDHSVPVQPLKIMQQCLSARARVDPRQVGFLDRLVIRYPKPVPGLPEGKSLGGTVILRNAVQVINFRSDHAMQVWDIQLFHQISRSHIWHFAQTGRRMFKLWGRATRSFFSRRPGNYSPLQGLNKSAVSSNP